IGVPLVNSPAFFERTIYVNPRDGKNVNRVFPGDANGSDSERVARYLTDALLADADAYIDVHAGDLIEALVPFTLYAKTRNAKAGTERAGGVSRAMPASYGLGYMLGPAIAAAPGAAYATAAGLGVPAMIAEVGQQGVYDQASVERHVAGLRNVLGVVGLLSPP